MGRNGTEISESKSKSKSLTKRSEDLYFHEQNLDELKLAEGARAGGNTMGGRGTMLTAAVLLGLLQAAAATRNGVKQLALDPAVGGEQKRSRLGDNLRTIFGGLDEESAEAKLAEEIKSGRCTNSTEEVDDPEFAQLLAEIGLDVGADLGGPHQLGLRKCYFKLGQAKVAELRGREATKARFKVNFFALLSREEASPWFGFRSNRKDGAVDDSSKQQSKRALADSGLFASAATSTPTPDSVDWVGTAVDPAVQDQGMCAGGWAFSASECISAINWVRNQNDSQAPLSLSAQQLLSCDYGNGNEGCNGGNFQNVWGGNNSYTATNALASTEAYPFESWWGFPPTCEANLNGLVTAATNVPIGVSFPAENDQLVSLLVKHPVSIAIFAAGCFQYYDGGTLTANDCALDMSNSGDTCPLDHAILLVGYEMQGFDLVFKVKNSWGDSWGDGGYAYFYDEADFTAFPCKGLLGMNMEVAYPALVQETAAGVSAADNSETNSPTGSSGDGGDGDDGDDDDAASGVAIPLLLAVVSGLLVTSHAI